MSPTQIAMDFIENSDRGEIDKAMAMIGQQVEHGNDDQTIKAIVESVTFHGSGVSEPLWISYGIQLDNALNSVIRFVRPESLKVIE